MQKYGQYSQFSPVGHLPPRLFKDFETPAWLGLTYSILSGPNLMLCIYNSPSLIFQEVIKLHYRTSVHCIAGVSYQYSQDTDTDQSAPVITALQCRLVTSD